MSWRVALDALADRCASVADEGTDPAALAHVVAWTIRPRRGLESLRRRCRDAETVSGPPARALIRLIAGEIDADDARNAVAVVEAWRERDCRVALVGDPGYPPQLAEGWPDLDAPVWLVRRGRMRTPDAAVAIVGSRRASGYGVAVAAWLADAAAAAGVQVVSGGAVGIDAAAHRAALERVGGTLVVLGCGHAVSYPRNHARPGALFDAIIDRGGALVSELLPYEPPRAGPVRARNRIVAALADVVVVVEGSARSGALLTAGAAAERGRPVLAVPGDVRAPGSAAPHRLLQDGVAPCTSPADLLDALGRGRDACGATTGARSDPSHEGARASGERGERNQPPSTLPTPVHAVLASAWPRPVRIDDLATRSGVAVGALLAAITRARVAGEIAEDPGGIRLRRAPAR